jgi:hypothetical protein
MRLTLTAALATTLLAVPAFADDWQTTLDAAPTGAETW